MERAARRRRVVVAVLLALVLLIMLAILAWLPAAPEAGPVTAARVVIDTPAPATPTPPPAEPLVTPDPPPEPEVVIPEEPPVPEKLTVRGRVTTRDGNPLSGANVRAHLVTEIEGGFMSSDAGATRSGEDGSFELPLPPGATISLHVSREGYLPTMLEHRLPEANPETILIVLDLARTVTGRVVDLAGDPVAGADVNVRVRGPEKDYRELGQAKSDADGGVVFETIPPDVTHLRLAATKAGAGTGVTLVPLKEALAPTLVIVTLDPDRVLRLHVLEAESGRPLESPQIRIGLYRDKPPRMVRGRPVLDARLSVKQDADGSWLVIGAPDEGLIRLGVSAKHRTRFSRVKIRLDEFPLEVRLEKRDVVSISGTVVDEKDRPVANASVSASIAPRGPRPPRSHNTHGGARTDEKGRFVLDDLTRGYTYELEAWDWNHRLTCHPRMVGHEASRYRVVLRLERTGRIRGHLESSEEGIRIDQIGLRIDRSRADETSADRPVRHGMDMIEHGKSGRFIIGRLIEGVYDLRIMVARHIPYELKNVRIEAGKVTGVGRIVLSRGFRIVANLQDEAGRPRPGLRLTAVRMPDIFKPSAASKTNGRVALRLPAGEYRLFATSEERPIADLGTIRLGDEATTEITPVLVAPGHLDLVVRDGDGDPVPNVTVDLRADVEPLFERALVNGFRWRNWWPWTLNRGDPIHAEKNLTTDESGHLRLGPLIPGRYFATIGSATRTIEIRSGEETRDMLTVK